MKEINNFIIIIQFIYWKFIVIYKIYIKKNIDIKQKHFSIIQIVQILILFSSHF